ncbi:shikimate dehydrogenase family protein [Chitinophaga cymbidii]|uniref:Shikimate 5-dehydrogenase n=1 Tax=Chitinophaga cymbidii TaxID=1096750 RepID=A0A512RKW2_9BACT|nr:shikimate dehydrogenase [Chitinophaga cymbidii]GEP96302.1 shikimate 5-dehydrogenase [Chitinophaga cymbidii]
MRLFGLIGFPLSHSFSKGFFTEKFEKEGITGCRYENFPIPDIGQFPLLWKEHPQLEGLNVTIPYKQVVIPFLDELSEAAQAIGAVNCVRLKDGRLKGHNTDVTGFRRSLEPLLKPQHTKALILGAGGAAKAVKFALQQLGITYTEVSRKYCNGTIGYEAISKEIMDAHPLIINTTPLGMYPNVAEAPPIPYHFINEDHLLYDLVYNPAETQFMQQGAARGAAVKNGHEMLILQAEASWEIWNEK